MLTRSKLGRTALLLQFSAEPWRLPPGLVLQELRNFARATALDEALDALVYGPKQKGAQVDSVRGRVTICWGRNDGVLPSQAARAQELFPDATLHCFTDCGHFPHWGQPGRTAELILEVACHGARHVNTSTCVPLRCRTPGVVSGA